MALQSCTNFEMYRLVGPLPGFQSPAAFFHILSIPLSLAKPTCGCCARWSFRSRGAFLVGINFDGKKQMFYTPEI